MMADKLFTKRLRELTDEAIRESLAEISIEFEKRFGPAALTASPPVVEREAIARALMLAVEDMINAPFSLYPIEPMEVCEYRDRLYRIWTPLRDAILALTPVEGVGETTREQCAKVAERIAECANTSGRSGCCETTGAEIATAIRDLPLSTPVAQGDEVRAALERVLEALTPHGETKAAYMGEFSWTEWLPDENGVEQGHQRTVPWTTIKEIMAAIRDRASVEKLDEAKALATLTKGARDAG